MDGTLLITQGLILSEPGNKNTPAQPGFILIKDDSIIKIGPMEEASSVRSDRVIDASGCLAMPGLVNMHGHSAMTLFRGLADDLELSSWLNDHIFPAESRSVNKEMVYWCSCLAAAEMIMSGTTTVADAYFHEYDAARAFHDCGLRAIATQGVIDFPAPGVPDPAKNITAIRTFITAWQNRSPIITPAVFAHSPYTCSAKTLKLAKKTADEAGTLFFIHLAETKQETAIMMDPAADSPVRHLQKLNLLDKNTICVHCVWLDEHDIDILATTGAGVVTCPQSNMKLASGNAPVKKMLDSKIRVGLGTDSCASNNSLDMFREMDTAAKLAKIKDCDPTAVNAFDVLKMATSGGTSLGGDARKTGTLAPGQLADLILIDLHKPHLTPFHNHSLLVYSAQGNDVKTTIINGRVVMEDRKLTTIDLEETMSQVRRLALK